MAGWLGVDFDKTLAFYQSGSYAWASGKLGPPIKAMVEKVKEKLQEGVRVKIFTARVSPLFINFGPYQLELAIQAKKNIDAWCLEVFGQVLEVTAVKDFECFEIWDDRCKEVIPNTGEFVD